MKKQNTRTIKSKNVFPGYNVYRTNHPDGKAHASSEIIISSQIQHCSLSTVQLSTIQATNISIMLNHIPITISVLYCPPQPAIS